MLKAVFQAMINLRRDAWNPDCAFLSRCRLEPRRTVPLVDIQSAVRYYDRPDPKDGMVKDWRAAHKVRYIAPRVSSDTVSLCSNALVLGR